MFDDDVITIEVTYGCTHKERIMSTPGKAGEDTAIALTERCHSCEMVKDEEDYALDDDADDLSLEYKPSYCSHFKAVCHRSNTCYENVEFTDSECSNGMVLCTDVGNTENRYMYERDVLDDLAGVEPRPKCPEDTECSACSNYVLCAFLGYL